MIGILNIGLGNVQSVYNAIYENGYDPIFVDKPEDLTQLSHFILPGVGNFNAVMERLNTLGLVEAIQHFVISGKPTLGICLGMQLLAELGEEGGQTSGLKVIPAKVIALKKTPDIRIPHVGWNEVTFNQEHIVFDKIKDRRDFYFVHSYQVICQHQEHILATTNYGREIVCMVVNKNVIGVQFHPEKSQKNGMQMLENFCEWDGAC